MTTTIDDYTLLFFEKIEYETIDIFTKVTHLNVLTKFFRLAFQEDDTNCEKEAIHFMNRLELKPDLPDLIECIEISNWCMCSTTFELKLTKLIKNINPLVIIIKSSQIFDNINLGKNLGKNFDNITFGPNLKSLFLLNNSYNLDQMTILCQSLEKCKLETLYINSCTIDNESAYHLLDYLKRNNNIINLTFSQIYGLTDSYIISNIIKSCKSLKRLDINVHLNNDPGFRVLKYKYLDDTSIKEIGDALIYNLTLRYLKIDCLSKTGIECISKAIRINSGLHNLQITSFVCVFDDFFNALKINQGLYKCNLSRTTYTIFSRQVGFSRITDTNFSRPGIFKRMKSINEKYHSIKVIDKKYKWENMISDMSGMSSMFDVSDTLNILSLYLKDLELQNDELTKTFNVLKCFPNLKSLTITDCDIKN